MASLTGKLLVATPHLLDPNFYRAVVLIFLHDDVDGALGLVLNRVSTEPAADHLPAWSEHIIEPGLVHYGGPVEPEVALGLGWDTDGEGLGVIGLDLVDISQPPGPESPKIQVYSGYSGWEVGQLEGEIGEGSWFVLDAAPDDPFADPDTLWQRVLRRQPGVLAVLSTFPHDPELN